MIFAMPDALLNAVALEKHKHYIMFMQIKTSGFFTSDPYNGFHQV